MTRSSVGTISSVDYTGSTCPEHHSYDDDTWPTWPTHQPILAVDFSLSVLRTCVALNRRYCVLSSHIRVHDFDRQQLNSLTWLKSDSLGSKELMWSGSEFTFPRCKDDNYPPSLSSSSFIDHLFSIHHVL